MRKLNTNLALAASLVLLTFVSASTWAQDTYHNTLHAFCTGTLTCTTQTFSGGPVITTQTSLPTFGFTRSPDSNANLPSDVKIMVVALVPNTAVGAASLTFTVNGTHTGVASQAASLFSPAAWTTNINLSAYLGLTQTGGPSNPLDAWLPATQSVISSATGYFVYQANLGAVTFGSTTDPTFTISGVGGLPAGTVFMAYLVGTGHQGNTTIPGAMVDSTANSSALMLTPVPEPGAMALLGTGLVLISSAAKRLRMRKS